VKYETGGQGGRENTAMRENNTARVLVERDSASLARRHARGYDCFTTVRFEERKRSATAYGTFSYLMFRRFC